AARAERGRLAAVLGVGHEERAELDRLEAIWKLAVLPGSGHLHEPEVLPVPERLPELLLGEHAAVVRVAVDRRVVGDRADRAQLVHRHDEGETSARAYHGLDRPHGLGDVADM